MSNDVTVDYLDLSAEEIEACEQAHWEEVTDAIKELGERVKGYGFARSQVLQYMDDAFLSENYIPSKENNNLVQTVRGYTFSENPETSSLEERRAKVKEYLYNYYEGVQSILYPPQKPKVLTGGPLDRVSTYIAGGIAAAIGMGTLFGNFLERHYADDTSNRAAITEQVKSQDTAKPVEFEAPQFRKKADILERKNPVDDFKEIQQGNFTFENGKGDFLQQVSKFAYKHAPKEKHAQLEEIQKDFQRGQYAAFMRSFGSKSPRELDAILSRAPGDPQKVLLKKVISLIGEPSTWSRTLEEIKTEGGVTKKVRIKYEEKYQEQLKDFDEVRYALGYVYLHDVEKIGTDKDLDLIVGNVSSEKWLTTVVADEKSEDFIGLIAKFVSVCGEENLFKKDAPEVQTASDTTATDKGTTGSLLKFEKEHPSNTLQNTFDTNSNSTFDADFEKAFASNFSDTPFATDTTQIIEEKVKKSELNGRIEYWTKVKNASTISRKEIDTREIDDGWGN